MQAKIRVASESKIPYLLVVGPREAEQGTVSVRAHGIPKDLGALPAAEFLATLGEEIATRGSVSVLDRHFAGDNTELPAEQVGVAT